MKFEVWIVKDMLYDTWIKIKLSIYNPFLSLNLNTGLKTAALQSGIDLSSPGGQQAQIDKSFFSNLKS